MNKELNEKIEQRAKYLVMHFRPYGPRVYFERNHGVDCWGTHCLNDYEKKVFINMAKKSLTLELESEIRGMQSVIHSSFVQQSLDKVKELESQIEELKKND